MAGAEPSGVSERAARSRAGGAERAAWLMAWPIVWAAKRAAALRSQWPHHSIAKRSLSGAAALTPES